MNNSIESAISILEKLKSYKVKDIIICPGGRNAPFVEVLSKTNDFNVKSFFDERAAGFYALGLIKKNKSPACVITTSGTAVAEVLPAAIEASYQGLPLIIVSADRPKYYRGSGAPQSINQTEIFKNYCQKIFDVESNFDELNNFIDELSCPLHINICFEEPLLSEQSNQYIIKDKKIGLQDKPRNIYSIKLIDRLKLIKKPLIILGPIEAKHIDDILPILKKINAPIYAEEHSGFKNHPQLNHLLVKSGANFLAKTFKKFNFDSVIRIGDVPTLRLWRDLESLKTIPVFNFSDNQFSGLPRLKTCPTALKDISILINVNNIELDHDFFNLDQKIRIKLIGLVKKYPKSEQNFIFKISQMLDKNSILFLANSLPIREWDQWAQKVDALSTYTLRGANGIDGNFAYYLGLSSARKQNYCILGDLTALYDLSSGFIYNQFHKQDKVKVIIVNNGGGKIFKNLFENKAFENNHTLNFSGWANMFSLNYQIVNKPDELNFSNNNEVIELVPDNEQTEKLNKELIRLLDNEI